MDLNLKLLSDEFGWLLTDITPNVFQNTGSLDLLDEVIKAEIYIY